MRGPRYNLSDGYDCVAVGTVHGQRTFEGETPVPDVVVELTVWLPCNHVVACRRTKRDVLRVQHVAT